MKTWQLIPLVVLFSLSCRFPGAGQDFSVGVNAAELLDFGTLNVSAGYALSRHWSLEAGVRMNPWTFGKVDGSQEFSQIVKDVHGSVFNKRESFCAGVRWWPWFYQSELWVGAGLMFCSYDRGGWILGSRRRKGTAFGATMGLGWTLMLSDTLGLDVGVRGWAGRKNEYVYEDLYFTKEFTKEEGFAAGLDEVVVSLVFCF